ncbi:hypothetical protein ABEG17_05535 [Pedococcus sp. KACC 23699]|uniref:Uncharacterized protein n=1 Tax=Pedococcus sp. KACC 23699 TaxID=3149228 RepID=A0AAU7JWV6_9MICO
MTRRFQLARFASMLMGFALLAGSFFAYSLVSKHIGSDLVRWFAGAASLVVDLWLAYAVNATVVARVDPDGAQRAAVEREREATRRG